MSSAILPAGRIRLGGFLSPLQLLLPVAYPFPTPPPKGSNRDEILAMVTISLHARDAIVDSSRQFFNRETRSTPRGAEREKEKQGISTVKVARARRPVCLAKVFLRPVRRECGDPAARIDASLSSGGVLLPLLSALLFRSGFLRITLLRGRAEPRAHARLRREGALSRIKRVTEIYSSRKYIRLRRNVQDVTR